MQDSSNRQRDGFPSVERFSSLLNYLELCDIGVFIKSDTLDCELFKNSSLEWVGYGDEPLSARGVVDAVCFCMKEDDPEVDFDTVHVLMRPVDPVAIKCEIAASNDEEPDIQLEVSMTTAKFEWDAERDEFVAVFDSDAPGASCLQPAGASDYALPLHLRLPPLEKRARVVLSSPSPSPLRSPPPAASLAGVFEAELEADAMDAQIGMQKIADSPRATPLPKPAAPPRADPPPRLMPRAGSVVTVPIVDDDGSLTGREQTGFVFRVIRYRNKPEKDAFALVFPNCSWDAFKEAAWADKWRECITVPTGLPLGAIWRKEGTREKPEGFLFERQRAAAHGWELFAEYRAGGSGPPEQYHPPRLVQGLQAGQCVTCSGRVLGQQCNNASKIYFIAVAHGLEDDEAKQVRRVAIVAIDGKLVIAQLVSEDEGYVLPADPPSRMPDDQLAALQQQADAFISSRKVAATYRALMREPMVPSQLQLRPRRPPIPAAAPAEAEAVGAAVRGSTQSKSAKPCKPACPLLPDFPHDLKGVSVSRLRALSEAQLQQACEQREVPLAADAGGPQMLTALLQFRAKEGRSRRAASSSGGGGSSLLRDSDGGHPDFDDGDAFIRRGGSDGGSSDGSEEEREKEKQIEAKKQKMREKHEHKAREAREAREEREKREKREKRERKKRKKRARSPSSSSSSSSDSSTKPSPKHQKASPSSSCSTPWDVVKAREERDALEAARMARLNAKIDRHERKKHEKKRRH